MIVAIDTETGGLEPGRHPLLSIAIVRLDNNLAPCAQKVFYVEPHPGQIIDPLAAKVNGYTPEEWERRDARPLLWVMAELKGYLRFGVEPLAHNAGFDRAFLDEAQALTGIRLGMSYRWRCSQATFLACSDAFGWAEKKTNLETLAQRAGFWKKDIVRDTHDALQDALACAAGYRWLIQQIESGGQYDGQSDQRIPRNGGQRPAPHPARSGDHYQRSGGPLGTEETARGSQGGPPAESPR